MNLIQKILLESELDGEDEFDINFIFQPNERAKQELERRKKESKENFQKIKLGLKKINKAFENKQWKSKQEEFFLKSFYKNEVEVNLEELPNLIFIVKNGKVTAHQDLKSKTFFIKYKSIWRVFQKKFNWNYKEIESFMKTMLNKYFKLREYTPKYCNIFL